MEYTLRDLLSSVFRHKRALITFWVITLIALSVFITQTRKLYESKAEVLVSLGSESRGRAEYLNDKNLQILQREQQIHDEQQIFESRAVLLTAVKWIVGDPTPGLQPPPRDWRVDEAARFLTGKQPEATPLLRAVSFSATQFGKWFGKPRTHDQELEDMVRSLSKALAVSVVFDSDALDVTLRYRDPRVAQTILSLLIAAYMQHHIQVFRSPEESKLLKAQYDQSVAAYQDRLAQFSAYMKTHGVYSDDGQLNTLMDERERLAQSLDQATADGAADQARLTALRSIGQSLQRFEQYSSTAVRNKQRDELLTKLNDATLEQNALLARHPVGSREYTEGAARLDEIRRLLQQEPQTVSQEAERRRTKASELLDSEIVSVTEAGKGDLARMNQLRADMKKNDATLNRYADGLQGFDALKLDLDLAKSASERMASAYVESHLNSLTSQDAITDVALIDGPTWDFHQASPNKKLVAAITVLLLLVGSLAVVVSAVALDETLPDATTTKTKLGLDVIGTIPVLKEEESEQPVGELYAGEFARIYRALPKSGSEEGRVIAVLESNPGEGASTLGYGLASFLVRQAHEKSAFIDLTAHPPENLIRDNASLGAGPELVDLSKSGQDILAAVQSLRKTYANVIVASGPVRTATDLLGIGAMATESFLIIEAAKTRTAAARSSVELLRRFGFQNIKVLLNKRRYYIPNWLMRYV